MPNASRRDPWIRGSDGELLAGQAQIYHILPVPIEGNSQGCSVTRPYPAKPPEEWMRYFVRQAPFEIAEVLVETDSVDLEPDMTHAVLFDMGISPDAKPGRYTGQLSIESAGSSALAPFSLIVHKTVVREYALDSTHWFWPSPEYLTTELQPEWWSEKHWKLIENSGHRLAEYGQNVILTPLVEGAHPLVQTRLSSTGAYTFDFSQFERWVHLFLSLGFEKIEGAHLTTRAGISSKDIFAYDERSGKTKQIFEESHSPADQEAWLDYLAKFLDALYAELEAKQWTSLYLQHIADEPSGEEQHLINYKLFRPASPI